MLSHSAHGRSSTISTNAEPYKSGSQHASRRTVRWVQWTFLSLALCLMALVSAVGWRYQRVHANHVWLASTGANYFWYHEIPRLEGVEWKKFQVRLAPVINPATLSDFYAVKFESGDLTDQELSRIGKLTEVRLLTVASNAATDQTLARMTSLHQLQGLTLKGKQFTFEGLLQLRRLPRLRNVTLQDMTLSMAELAVLESAIPQANLKYNGSDALSGYRRQLFARYIVTETTPAAVEYGFQPLFSTEQPTADTVPVSMDVQAVETVDNRNDEGRVRTGI